MANLFQLGSLKFLEFIIETDNLKQTITDHFQPSPTSRIGLAVIQRNVRKFLFLRNWTWWKLYTKVQPLLSIARAEDEMKEKEEELKKAQEQAKADEEKRMFHFQFFHFSDF